MNGNTAINKRKESPAKILYFIQLPPPVHGVSMMNNIIYYSSLINKNLSKYLVEIKFSSQLSEIRQFNLKKILKFLAIAVRLFINLSKIKPDVVYFSLMPVGKGFIRDFFYAMIIKLYKSKIIYHLNNIGISNYSKKLLFKWMYKTVFKNSIIIHPSEILLKKELENLKLVNIKTFIIPNTCMLFSYSKIKSEKNKNGIVKILFFSNLLPEKGLMVLLEAIKNISDKVHNYELKVYGNYYRTTEVNRYIRFISENNLSEKVFIMGPCFNKEKERVFLESDIFVFPSFFSEECFPLVILEAMQAKLAIISSSVGAVPEIIEDGVDGLLVEPKDYLLLASKIQLLVNNKKLRYQLGNKASDKYLKQYSRDIFEKRICKVLLSG